MSPEEFVDFRRAQDAKRHASDPSAKPFLACARPSRPNWSHVVILEVSGAEHRIGRERPHDDAASVAEFLNEDGEELLEALFCARVPFVADASTEIDASAPLDVCGPSCQCHKQGLDLGVGYRVTESALNGFEPVPEAVP